MRCSILRFAGICLTGLVLLFAREAEDTQIVHMLGTYDLDADGYLEFIALERPGDANHPPNLIRYYELGADGYQDLLWELSNLNGSLQSIAGATIGDLDGNGTPELITVMNVADPEQEGILSPMAFAYPWTEDGFMERPLYAADLAPNQRFVRCQSFVLADVDADGDQEILAALGAPKRSAVVVDVEPDATPPLQIRAELVSPALQNGFGFVYVAAVDYNWDQFDDVILFSPEGNVIRTAVFYNRDGDWVAGPEPHTSIPGISSFQSLIQSVTDWDGDGFQDVILPFRSGHVVALTLSATDVAIETLPVDAGPLSDLNITDFDQDGYLDILAVSGATNLLGLYSGLPERGIGPADYFSLVKERDSTQVFTTLPLVKFGHYTGSLIAAGWDGVKTTVFQTELGLEKAAIPADQEQQIWTPERIQTTLDNQQSILQDFPEIDETEVTESPALGQPLPAGILPRHILPVNQPFAYTIPEEPGEEFYSFRWLETPPPGMYFHYETQSIRWVPELSHLGAWSIAYRVKMKIGETVQAGDDSLSTYQVEPVLETMDEHVWLYVNDPPVFVSEPEGTEFIANSLFTYEPQVRDRNRDAQIHYFLEQAPDGMFIDDGMLVWQTDSTHVNVYDVRLVASDGFDRQAQEFQLFARAGVRILSQPDRVLTILQPYEYQLDVWHQDLDVDLTFELPAAPEGMTISDEGLIRWTPAETQIDTQRFVVIARHGVAADTQQAALFVNHPPVVVQRPESMTLVNVGDIWEFELEAMDPNQRDKLVYTAHELPPKMRMDPIDGHLRWEPTGDEVDFSHLQIEISDGRESRYIDADFFVNAPVKVISIPPLIATVGEPYSYKITINDRNTGALAPFDEIVEVPDAANTRVYEITINDDIAVENIQRYLSDWNLAETVYLTDPDLSDENHVSRLNVKKYVRTIFYEDDRLFVFIETIDSRTVEIKDVLWEFFQGNKGRPPKVSVNRSSLWRYTLTEFPEGMTIDAGTGTLHWTPTKDQVDKQTVSLTVSDGYTKDEQMFEIYVNHPPVIISTPPVLAQVDEPYSYQVRVEDRNAQSELAYELVKGPPGMQMDRGGKIQWIPRASQINTRLFEIKVSDGYREDIQSQKVFVNIAPSIISTPKPVTLTGYEYRYRVVAEDLNKDQVHFRSVKLPKNSKFNTQTGMFTWKPRNNQRGPNDVVIMAIDEHGATTPHEFQVHVFEDPSARQFVQTGWPLMLTFVGVMFAWGITQI